MFRITLFPYSTEYEASCFTDPGDVVIDPVAGSGSTLIAAINTGRKGIGFEIKSDFHAKASAWIAKNYNNHYYFNHKEFYDEET